MGNHGSFGRNRTRQTTSQVIVTILLTSGVLASLVTSFFNYRGNQRTNQVAVDVEKLKNDLKISSSTYEHLYEVYTQVLQIQQQPIYLSDALAPPTSVDSRDQVGPDALLFLPEYLIKAASEVASGQKIDRIPFVKAANKRAADILAAYERVRPLLDEEFRKPIDALVKRDVQIQNEAVKATVLHDPAPLTPEESGKKLLELLDVRAEIEKEVKSAIMDQMDRIRGIRPTSESNGSTN